MTLSSTSGLGSGSSVDFIGSDEAGTIVVHTGTGASGTGQVLLTYGVSRHGSALNGGAAVRTYPLGGSAMLAQDVVSSPQSFTFEFTGQSDASDYTWAYKVD